nr:MAG TPA: hypothetical protein [Caudoviricetes sp.]
MGLLSGRGCYVRAGHADNGRTRAAAGLSKKEL